MEFRTLDSRPRQVYLKSRVARTLGLRGGDYRRVADSARTLHFVCHGNIIRSAFSAALMRELLGPDAAFQVESAGVAARAGRPSDPRALALASEFGISLDDHAAKALTPELVAAADAILIMDYLNEANLLDRYPEAAGKLHLIGAYDSPSVSGRPEVDDPYTGDSEDVRRAFVRLRRCVEALAEQLAGRPSAGMATPSESQP